MELPAAIAGICMRTVVQDSFRNIHSNVRDLSPRAVRHTQKIVKIKEYFWDVRVTAMISRKMSMYCCITEKWELREVREGCKDSACNLNVFVRGKNNLSYISIHYIK